MTIRTLITSGALLLVGSWPQGLVANFVDKHVLFIRGADRTGGFLEAGNDVARTEQLADIYNDSTSNGNHGWAEFRQTLENFAFWTYQDVEFTETTSGPAEGRPLDLTSFDLNFYDVIVFGSNNAVYEEASIDAFETYVRNGGSALFISDANFGGSWADAPRSDQQFLDRFGLVVNQDRGTYSLFRDQGDFLAPDHPVLAGVNQFDGEGVSPFVVVQENLAEGVSVTILAKAKGQTRINEPPFDDREQGNSRATNENDASLFVAHADKGRLAGHFDRNTFFNLNGAGTNIDRFDNQRLALNLFSWLANRAPRISIEDKMTVLLPGEITLLASAEDDGWPQPSTPLNFLWEMVSGPGEVNFANPDFLVTTAEFSEAGTYELSLTVDDGDRTTTQTTTIEVLGGFEAWLSLYFNEEQLNDLSLVGPEVDFDGDGFSNRQEFSLGRNPAEPESMPTFQIDVIEGSLTVTYRQRLHEDTLAIDPEVSGNLASTEWLSGEAQLDVQVLETVNGISLMQAKDRTGGSPRFMRLRFKEN